MGVASVCVPGWVFGDALSGHDISRVHFFCLKFRENKQQRGLIMKVLFLGVLIVLPLAGCSSSSDLFGNDSQGDPSLEITSFSVTGTSGATENVPVINPAENDGSFQISWTTESSDTIVYSAHVYLDDDPDYEDNTDLHLDSIAYVGYMPNADSSSESITCNYSNDQRIICQDGPDADDNSDTNIEDSIDTVPQNLYFILRVCSMHNTDNLPETSYCKTSSLEIQFQ